jgi:hypothetical protein
MSVWRRLNLAAPNMPSELSIRAILRGGMPTALASKGTMNALFLKALADETRRGLREAG